MVSILQKDAPVLRGKAAEVPKEDIGSANLAKIIHDMSAAMADEKDAVAIAAPQIGVPLRLFVVAGKVFEKDAEKDAAETTEKKSYRDIVFINPKITRLSRKKIPMDEGCLSVRFWYGAVERAEKATVTALDETGKKFTRGASGLLAQVFQHETDHLDGVLFTDKASGLREEPPKMQEETKERA